MNKITSTAVLLIGLALMGCDNKGTNLAPKHASESAASGYLKPGAAVRFSHNYEGPLQPGQQQAVELAFKVAHQSGQLSIKLQADTGLNIDSNANNYWFSLDTEQPYIIEQTIGADVDGKYYLNIFTEVLDEQGQTKTRVFAIGVQVGDKTASIQGKSAPIIENSRGEPIVLFPAQESLTLGATKD
ncbi:MAG: hypothetical protein P8P26_02845 [Porticoccaceae bacterium]|nr:hypothetical protein [Porticoccaceae bacterium]